MAKVKITIKDLPGDKVHIDSDPNFETMMQMKESGHELTSAHGYALFMLNRAREKSAEKGPMKILIPRKGLS